MEKMMTPKCIVLFVVLFLFFLGSAMWVDYTDPDIIHHYLGVTPAFHKVKMFSTDGRDILLLKMLWELISTIFCISVRAIVAATEAIILGILFIGFHNAVNERSQSEAPKSFLAPKAPNS